MRRFLSIIALLVALALLMYAPALLLNAQDHDAKWGTLKGRIFWNVKHGPVPERKPLHVNTDKIACLAKGPILDQAFVIHHRNQGMANVLVWLEPLKAGGELPIHPTLRAVKEKHVGLEMPSCMFEPRLLALREGQEVVVKNNGQVTHNVRWNGNPNANPGGNVVVEAGTQYVIQGLQAQKLPLVAVDCLHSWMTGYIAVFNHPYFAVTDADGNFEIKHAPRGNYKLMVWHESGYRGGEAGRGGQQIAIPGGRALRLGDLPFNVK